jgi:hypothetical protein
MRSKKLTFNKESIRALSTGQLDEVGGGIESARRTCVECSGWLTCLTCPTQQLSGCRSCYHTDCCLMRP